MLQVSEIARVRLDTFLSFVNLNFVPTKTEVRAVLSRTVNHVFNDCKRVILNAGISLVQDVTHSFTSNGWEEAYALALTLFFYPDIMLVS